MRSLFFANIALIMLCVSTISSAQAPDPLSFQGFVTDTTGTPIESAGVSMIFKLYEGSSEIWSETHPSVEIVAGVFNVLLGSVAPLNAIRFDRALSLGIKVGADSEMSPRTPLATAAYAKALPGLYTFYSEDTENRRSHNVVGGAAVNVVGADVIGATISGGGGTAFSGAVSLPNRVLANWATVGGGFSNTASGDRSTVGGGDRNTASATRSTVAGRERSAHRRAQPERSDP